MSVQGANIDRRSLKRHHSQIHRTLGRTGASIREGVGVRTPSGNKTPHTESGPQERAVCTTTITQESRALEKALKLEEVHITPCNLGLPSVMLGESCRSLKGLPVGLCLSVLGSPQHSAQVKKKTRALFSRLTGIDIPLQPVTHVDSGRKPQKPKVTF